MKPKQASLMMILCSSSFCAQWMWWLVMLLFMFNIARKTIETRQQKKEEFFWSSSSSQLSHGWTSKNVFRRGVVVDRETKKKFCLRLVQFSTSQHNMVTEYSIQKKKQIFNADLWLLAEEFFQLSQLTQQERQSHFVAAARSSCVRPLIAWWRWWRSHSHYYIAHHDCVMENTRKKFERDGKLRPYESELLSNSNAW